MLSAIFLLFAVIHLTIWIWGWRQWSATGKPRSLLVILFAGTLLFYDNVRIGSGRFIGEGDLLQAMTYPAFIWHWLFLPLLIIGAASIARDAGLGWAQNKFVMGGFCVIATALILLDVPKLFDIDLYPNCIDDTVRYTTSLSENARCRPTDVLVASGGFGEALVAILTNVFVLGIGIALWIQRRWPWLAIGSGIMFIAAGAFASSRYSLPIANCGEIFITLGLVLSARHFAGLKHAGSDPGNQSAASRA